MIQAGEDTSGCIHLWICNFYIDGFIADLLSFLLASRRSASMDRTAVSFPPLVNRPIRQIVSIALDRFFSSPNRFFLFFSHDRFACSTGVCFRVPPALFYSFERIRYLRPHEFTRHDRNSPRTIVLDCNIHRLKKNS